MAPPVRSAIRKTIAQVLLVHLGFHAFWMLLYCVMLLGVFVLIPLVGWYNAFVLGFLGKSVLASATGAAVLGFAVFGVTGLLSGWVISLFRPKLVWIPALFSLFVTGVVLVSATWMRYKYIGVAGLETILSFPARTGRADTDKLTWAIKAESMEDLPPSLAGKDVLIPFSELQPLLRLLPKDFQLEGGPYVYCNLPPRVWRGLKKDAAKKYPLLWSTQPDATGKRLVVSVDLKTDQFSDELVSEEALAQMLNSLENEAHKVTGGMSLNLRK